MDPDFLRIILALVGGLLIAGLYFWERRRRSEDDEDWESGEAEGSDEDGKREPRLGPWKGGAEPDRGGAGDDEPLNPQESGASKVGSVQADSNPPDGSQPEFELEPPPAPPKDPPPEFPPGPMLLTLHVVARDAVFEGADIVHAAGHCGLEPGEMDIFHCALGDEDHSQTLFSMANMVKPGTFPFGAMAEFQSPGLTLFAELEGTHDDPGRMEELLGTAHALAEDLGGEIRDSRRELFTEEAERCLRERVMAFVEVRLSASPA
jgi:cell division protein ZipA